MILVFLYNNWVLPTVSQNFGPAQFRLDIETLLAQFGVENP